NQRKIEQGREKYIRKHKQHNYKKLDREHLQNIPVPPDAEEDRMIIINTIDDFEWSEEEIMKIVILSEKRR
ncbi:MAG: hypothetical protein ACKPKO_10390, partial [Candidatus Fonsibacter sp.]